MEIVCRKGYYLLLDLNMSDINGFELLERFRISENHAPYKAGCNQPYTVHDEIWRNGMGKEHIAHYLHDKSKRAGEPFMAMDRGSLTKELVPLAFFGYVKGVFTGADSAKKGYFHEAEGSTLFLDEVGNPVMETQQMLFCAIRERQYHPVGDKEDRSFNVCIFAAINEDREVVVGEKCFWQDLLYCLHDFEIIVLLLRYC